MCQTLGERQRERLFSDFCVHFSLSCTLLQLQTTVYMSGVSTLLCFILPPLNCPLVAKHLPVTRGNLDNLKGVSRRPKNNRFHLKCHGALCAYMIICGSLLQWQRRSALAAMINARCNDIILRRLWQTCHDSTAASWRGDGQTPKRAVHTAPGAGQWRHIIATFDLWGLTHPPQKLPSSFIHLTSNFRAQWLWPKPAISITIDATNISGPIVTWDKLQLTAHSDGADTVSHRRVQINMSNLSRLVD